MRAQLSCAKTALLAAILTALFASCQGFAVNEKVIGNYYLVSVDTYEDINLSHHLPSDGGLYATVIPKTVFAVGYNKRYIIAKRHSLIDKANIDFYIVPVKDSINWRSDTYLIGPLTFGQFENKRRELGIENIKFTIVYKDLE